MDERREKSKEPPTLVGLPSAPVVTDRPIPDEDLTDFQSPDPGTSSPPPVDESGRDGEGEVDEALPAWSEDVSSHSSWVPPDSYSSHSSPKAAPADPSRPSEHDGTDFPAVSDFASSEGQSASKTPSGGLSSPTKNFDPDELSPTRVVEGQLLLKKYILKKKLGSGGMGEVWKVHHITLDCDRALKFIRTGLSDSPELHKRFRREARAMAKVSHPNAVEIHDAFTVGGMAFIDMALVPGRSLSEIFKAGRPMPLDWTVRILQQLCEVLTVAHEAGIVHRDLKPANLMLLDGRPTGREFLKVLDFGIAKLLSIEEADGASITNNAPIGTYPYMSPEQFGIGTAPVDIRSDIYAVGVILFEFLTGYRPHSAKNQLYQWIQKHLNEPVPTFRERNPEVDLPAEVEAVVRRCLAKTPENRPQSAQELFEEFDLASGLLRPPTRSGSANYLITPAPSTTQPPAPTDLASGRSDSQGVGPASTAGASDDGSNPERTPAKPSSSTIPMVAELSTFSGSFECMALEASAIPPTIQTLEGSKSRWRDPAVARTAAPPRGLWRFVALAACVLLIASVGVIAAFVVRNFREPTKKREQPLIVAKYEPVQGGMEWEGFQYERYQHSINHKVIFLPAGYRPVGTELAEDDWPRMIERAEDNEKFIRIAGTTTPYKVGKPVWKPGDPQDGRWLFEKGDPEIDKETEKNIPGFYLQKTEVTNRELARYYKANEGDSDLRDRLYGWFIGYLEKLDDRDADLPAVFVDIESARGYARSVGGMLPSRAEWEYAASSRGIRTDYVWGPLGDKEFADVCIGQKRRLVGKSKKDVTEQGLVDMGGNVREWSGDLREGRTVACGGCFDDSTPFKLDACGIKAVQDVSKSENMVGFRVLLRCPPAEGKATP